MAIKILLTDKKLLENKVDAVAFFVEQDFDFSKFQNLAKSYCPNLEKLMKDKKFTGKANSIFITPANGENFTYLIFAGLGKEGFENYRRAIGRLVRTLNPYSIKNISFELPDKKLLNNSDEYIAQQTAITCKMADYIFDEFLTEGEKDSKILITINIAVPSEHIKILQKSVDEGVIIGDAVNNAREWADLPANKISPEDFANHAVKISKENGLKCTIFNEDEIIKMGMGGIQAVASGSEKEARLVIMEYHTAEKNAPTVAFVGKGITFDSGGLSLKPAASMETMKDDMCGGAAVLSAMKVLGKFKPKINIIALAPFTENMPSGSAAKPGDIITFYNGKTAEVKNTDAEGRLILADALSYAIKNYKLDAIIDLATLTGACAYALGPFFTGLFSEHEDFVQRVFQAADSSGDYVWRLPLTNDYKPAVKCEIADLCNIGKKQYQAGATTAACFLQYFVGDVPWVHLDIAGSSFDVPDISYYRPHSATGVGVRLLVDLAMNWKK